MYNLIIPCNSDSNFDSNFQEGLSHVDSCRHVWCRRHEFEPSSCHNDNDNEIFLFNIIIDYVTVRIHTFQVCQLSAEFHYVYERYNIELK